MKRILSIDDEPQILECFDKALSRKGYEITVTSDPYQGLEMLKNEDHVDLAMLDIKMPGLNGFDIYREFRKVREIPTLFVTAYPKSFNTSSDDIVKMWQEEFADGTTDILYKPFDLATLYEKVSSLIGDAEE